jgi:hypothetical protein
MDRLTSAKNFAWVALLLAQAHAGSAAVLADKLKAAVSQS